jgi:hypothetical protein
MEMNHSFEKLNDSIKSIKSLEFNDKSEYEDFKNINDSGLHIASFENDKQHHSNQNRNGYSNLAYTSKGKSTYNSTYVDLNEASVYDDVPLDTSTDKKSS